VDVGRANRNSLWLHPAHLSAVLDCRRLFQSLSHFPLLFLPVSGRFFHSVTLSLAPLIWRLRPSFKVPLCRRPISDVAFHFLLHVLVYRIKSTNGYNYQFLLDFYGTLKLFSGSVYYSSSLLFNSMSNVSGHGQMAIVSSCRFVTVVVAAATETGSNRIGRCTQPIPLPLLPAYHLLLWNVLIVKSLYCLSLFLSLSPFH
jgi:hypothetical protein